MKIYGLKNCDSCRAARKALPEADFIDLSVSEIPEDDLLSALKQFEILLVNKRSTTWRGISEDDRSLPIFDLLRAYPKVMKRPLILSGDKFFLGWSKEIQSALAE